MSDGLGPLRQVALSVDDVDRAVAFYRDVLRVEPIARYGDLAFFDLAGVRLLLEPGGGGHGSVLYLVVDDIHAARSDLVSRGVAFIDEPHVIFVDTDGTFGAAGQAEWMTFFHDSEGNVLALSSRQAP
jgi:catechol 2,3-dioxygenase-like lactoylglutathione lyase family enzyme